MVRSWTYRVIAYSLITLLSIVVLVPSVADWFHQTHRLPSWFRKTFVRKITLGLDLQGGLRLYYEVDVNKVVTDKLDRLGTQVADKLAKDKKIQGIKTEWVNQGDEVELHMIFASRNEANQLDDTLIRDLGGTEITLEHQDTRVILRISPAYLEDLQKSVIDRSIETINNRINAFGVAETGVQRYQKNGIVIELAGVKEEDFERFKNLIGKTAQLEFKIVDDQSDYMQKLSVYAAGKKNEFPGLEYDVEDRADKQGRPHREYVLKAKQKETLDKFLASLPEEYRTPSDHQILFEYTTKRNAQGEETQDRIWRTYYLFKKVELTGEYLVDAGFGFSKDPNDLRGQNRAEVNIEFNSEGAVLFEKVTGDHVGQKMAIILDDKVMSAPSLETKIGGGRARITMGGDPQETIKEAKDLVTVLRTGALPAPLKKKSESHVGATLGFETVQKAKIAMIIGTLAVILFMLIYYRKSGLIANIAMILNVLYLLAILALFQATLTLPGIAAVVLTVGMAVDANIIIYERIREELRAGKLPRSAVDAGFNRAFWTVFDAHVTNLVAGIVLYSYGTGPIRGFAVSLIAGIVCNLFTSVWLSRAMFEWLAGHKKITKLSI